MPRVLRQSVRAILPAVVRRHWVPVVNERGAAVLRELGWTGEYIAVSPPLPGPEEVRQAEYRATLPRRMQAAADELNERLAGHLPDGTHFEWTAGDGH